MARQRDTTIDEELHALGERLTEARFQTAARRRETVSRDRMAELIAEVTGKPLHETQWRRYEKGQSEPGMSIVRAAAKLSGLSEAYLFGIRGGEEIIDPARDRQLTDEELDRAKRVAESTPEEKAKTKGAGRRRA